MSFWFNKRETGSPYETGDGLFNEAVTLSHVPGRTRDAERCLAAAIDVYRVLAHETQGIEAKRRLAKALWREAVTTLTESGKTESALAEGREAIELGRELLATLVESYSAFDPIIQEVSGAMNDVAQICHAAGKSSERERLLIEAAAVARRSSGPGARQALGTATHNLAQHWFHALRERTPGRWSELELMRIFSAAERAFEIRQTLCDDPRSQPYHEWELASSALQLGQLLHLLGQPTTAAQVLHAGLARLRDKSGNSVEALREGLLGALAATGAPSEPSADVALSLGSLTSLSRGDLLGSAPTAFS